MTLLKKQNIVVIGISRYTKVVIDIIEKIDKYNIVSIINPFIDNKEESPFKNSFLDIEAFYKSLKHLNVNSGIIAIEDNTTRKLVFNKIKQMIPDFDFITAIHPQSFIDKNVKIGNGTIIEKDVRINDKSVVGNFCILNSKVFLKNDSNINDFSKIVKISIGKNSIVSSGAFIKKEVGHLKIIYREPTKIIKNININNKKLYCIDSVFNDYKVIKNKVIFEVITNKEGWDEALKEINYYDFYHTYDYHMLSKAENETPILLKYVENNIIIALPLLIRKIENTNYKDATSVYGYAGPISKNLSFGFDNTQFQEKIKKYFETNNFVSVFSRLNPFIPGQCRALINLGSLTKQGKVVNIDLKQDIDIQRQNFQNRLKTHINKARRCCTIKRASSEEGLQKFMDIYYENMDRVHAKKSYYFTKDYFQKMVSSQDFKSEVLLAIDNESGETIAASQFVMTNNIVQYHLSGTKNDFLHLTPTKLLIDEMRLIASEKGYTYFNLGGGLGGKDDDSLFNFKASFSKDFKDFFLWKFICNQEVYDKLILKKGVDTDSNFFPLYRSLDDINVTL